MSEKDSKDAGDATEGIGCGCMLLGIAAIILALRSVEIAKVIWGN